MNFKILIVGVIVVIVLGTFIYSGNKNSNKEVEGVQTQTTDLVQSKGSSFESKSQSIGAVEVEVIPSQLEPGQNMIFDLSLNTHSVELNYDYTQILTAEDNNGNTHKALNWSGGNSGHHLSGEVEFEVLSEDAQSIKLIVNGIDNQNATFKWEL